MSKVALLLNPSENGKRFTNQDCGVAFRILPITANKHNEIRKHSLDDNGDLDVRKWGENYAVAAIAGWGPESEDDPNQNTVGDSTGPLPCNEENKRAFGRSQCVLIMPWVIGKATGLEQFRIEEEAAAKKG